MIPWWGILWVIDESDIWTCLDMSCSGTFKDKFVVITICEFLFPRKKWHNILKWHILRQKVWFLCFDNYLFRRTPIVLVSPRPRSQRRARLEMDSNLSVSNKISLHYKYPPKYPIRDADWRVCITGIGRPNLEPNRNQSNW